MLTKNQYFRSGYIAITKTLVIAQGNKLQNILFILGGGYYI